MLQWIGTSLSNHSNKIMKARYLFLTNKGNNISKDINSIKVCQYNPILCTYVQLGCTKKCIFLI